MNNRSILVVEDDADLRTIVSELLTLEGYDVTTARDGQDGWDKLRKKSDYRLVLLDYTMPSMDARGFRELQRQDPMGVGKIPVILFTAAVLDESVVAQLAPSAVLKKPVDIEVLINTVKRFLDGQAAQTA